MGQYSVTIIMLKSCLYDTRYKFYGDELVEVLQSKYPIFNPDNIEIPRKKRKKIVENIVENNVENIVENNVESNADRAKRRAKKSVYDFAMCNPDLNYFVTLTLDEREIDRYNYSVIVERLNIWLDNRVRRKGLKYLLVAEFHKDGAIHFHALFNDVLPRVDSGHCCQSDGQQKIIYNLPDWTFGFSTAIMVTGDRHKVCNYIVKYITKSGDKVGGRWYYHGGNLKKPRYEYDITDFQSLDGFGECFEFPVENTQNVLRIYNKL